VEDDVGGRNGIPHLIRKLLGAHRQVGVRDHEQPHGYIFVAMQSGAREIGCAAPRLANTVAM
jgi:hypothetical protein